MERMPKTTSRQGRNLTAAATDINRLGNSFTFLTRTPAQGDYSFGEIL